MRSVAEKIPRDIAVVVIGVDRLLEVRMSVIDAAVQHRDMDLAGVRM